MRTEVTGVGFTLTESVRGDARRRMLLEMSRFGPGIQAVTVRLTESQNPLGGVDRRCRVRARLRSGLLLQAEAVNGDLADAIGRSASRLARLVAIALDGGDGRPAPPPATRRPGSRR